MTTTRPVMIRPYIEDTRIGDGYRTAFVLREGRSRTVLFVPSLLATVEVPPERVRTAKAITYRPRVVRENMLTRARMMRTYGHRFPRRATVEILRWLGAGRASITEAVQAPPLPEVVATRARQRLQAEQAEQVRAVGAAIQARIVFAATHPPRRTPVRRRARQAHPDQLVLAL